MYYVTNERLRKLSTLVMELVSEQVGSWWRGVAKKE
jgi:hypothetical protein